MKLLGQSTVAGGELEEDQQAAAPPAAPSAGPPAALPGGLCLRLHSHRRLGQDSHDAGGGVRAAPGVGQDK